MNAVDAIGASWNATKGNGFTLFLFILAALVLNFFGLLALGIGLLVTVPWTTIAFVHAYRALAGEKIQKTEVLAQS